MKITIELEGKAVEVINVPPSGAAGASLDAEPPAELLAAARATGAQSAGLAAFSLPLGAPAPLPTIDVTEHGALPDLDAGRAPGVAGRKRPAKKGGAKAPGRGK